MSAHTISRRNVNKVYEDGLWWLKVNGTVEKSRNGEVIVAPGPVVSTYHFPRERVLFSVLRDANPFFHFFESLWMLVGREDLEYVSYLLPRMKEYSDDGKTLQGTYGFRWRHYFLVDQVQGVIHHLENNPDSRRAVIQMWDTSDLNSDSKDIPCNTQIYVSIKQSALDMTVCCRSNDAIWGAHGANSVHFSYLQEYLACALGVMVGTLYQFSNNYHAYPGMPKFEKLWANPESPDLYDYGADMSPGPLMFQGDHTMFRDTLEEWLDLPHDKSGYPFLSGVAYPMWRSFTCHKAKESRQALDWADQIDAPDWRHACVAWLTRRYENEQSK